MSIRSQNLYAVKHKENLWRWGLTYTPASKLYKCGTSVFSDRFVYCYTRSQVCVLLHQVDPLQRVALYTAVLF